MTTEIFRNAVFEDPRRFDDVDFAIFDEMHFVDDIDRGTVWEESLIFAPPHVRFVGLSATIANLREFGEWIRRRAQHNSSVIEHTKRPVPLSHRSSTRRRRVPARAAAARAQFTNAPRAREAGTRAGRRERERRAGATSANAPGSAAGPVRAAPLRATARRDPDRACCRALLLLLAQGVRDQGRAQHASPPARPRRTRAHQDLFDEICARFELDPERIRACAASSARAEQGVGFHHAGMLPIHKEVVERLFTSGLLKLLFTTETFALGINMPARTVVFDCCASSTACRWTT
jgi:superfamily II RNA helicase